MHACLRHERIKPESVLPACYSAESFNKAYGSNIWPCRDRSTWDKVDETEVLPPVYEKKDGRPPKSRNNQPHEIQGKYGPKLSKHGVTLHCKHCAGPDHNSIGCNLKKMAFISEYAKKLVVTTQAQLQKEAEEAAIASASLQSEAPAAQNNELNQDIFN
jgi:hypothetical protein